MFRRKKNLTSVQLKRELEKVKREKELWDAEQEIREVKKSMRRFRLTKSETLTFFLIVNFTAVEIYCMAVMWMFGNLDALYAFITTLLAEPITLACYFVKSFKGKKEEEKTKLEHEKLELQEGQHPGPDSPDDDFEDIEFVNLDDAKG